MDRAAARRERLMRRIFALTATCAAHIAVIGLMASSLADRQARPPEPDVEARLLSLYLSTPGPEGARSKRPHEPPRRRPSARVAISPDLRVAPRTAAPAAPASKGPIAEGATESQPRGPAKDEDARVRAALRSLADCDYGALPNLTGAERERCRRRLDQATRQALALPAGPADPGKRALLDHEVRVDEAFRAYRRTPSPDDYPGLRTFIPALKPLFGDEPRLSPAKGSGSP